MEMNSSTIQRCIVSLMYHQFLNQFLLMKMTLKKPEQINSANHQQYQINDTEPY